MVDWEVTATTIYCDAVDDEVTVMIYRDGTAKCTGQKKYATPDKETVRAMKRKSKQPGRQTGCRGDGCLQVKQYRDEILGEK